MNRHHHSPLSALLYYWNLLAGLLSGKAAGNAQGAGVWLRNHNDQLSVRHQHGPASEQQGGGITDAVQHFVQHYGVKSIRGRQGCQVRVADRQHALAVPEHVGQYFVAPRVFILWEWVKGAALLPLHQFRRHACTYSILIGLTIGVSPIRGATYYVATNGSD